MVHLTFVTSNDAEIVVDSDIFFEGFIPELLTDEDPADDSKVPLALVHEREFRRIVKFLLEYRENDSKLDIPCPLTAVGDDQSNMSVDLESSKVAPWAIDFARSIDMKEMVALLQAADHLQLDKLLSLLCARLAEEIYYIRIDNIVEYQGKVFDMPKPKDNFITDEANPEYFKELYVTES